MDTLYDIASELEEEGYIITTLEDAKITAYKKGRKIFVHFDKDYGDWNITLSKGEWQTFHASGKIEDIYLIVKEIL